MIIIIFERKFKINFYYTLKALIITNYCFVIYLSLLVLKKQFFEYLLQEKIKCSSLLLKINI